jgi:hypothetical protein
LQLSCRIVGKVEVLCDPWAILVLRDIMFGRVMLPLEMDRQKVSVVSA